VILFLVAMPPSKPDPLSGRIFTLRGQRVLVDADLAKLYGVTTIRFNQAVKRNVRKFPGDFRFRLTLGEFAGLKAQVAPAKIEPIGEEEDSTNSSQIVMSSRRGASYRPWAFTEHGCLMAAMVLRSPRAVQMSLYVVRAFVRMREELATNATILKRLAEMDRTLLEHDAALLTLWRKLRPLLAPPPESVKRKIGFHAGNR